MDHFDGPDFTLPGGDARLDLIDLFVFRAQDDPDRSVFALDANPLAPTLADEFHPEAVYRLNIDTDGDARPDLAFSVVFSRRVGDQQAATVYRVAGEAAREADASGEPIFERAEVSLGNEAVVHEAGGYRFFAGIRSEPMFVDLEGFFNDLQFTGSDFGADKNCFSIVLELPSIELGERLPVTVWGRTSLRRNGGLVPVDRVGRPGTTNGFFQGPDKAAFNQAEPADDRALFLSKVTAAAQHVYGYPQEMAQAIAESLLPDVLPYDPSSQQGFPVSGRRLEDDVVDLGIQMMTQGRLTGDGVGPHTDYLPRFPYLGAPHPIAPDTVYQLPGPMRAT